MNRLDIIRFLCANGHVTVQWKLGLEGPPTRCAKCGSVAIDPIEEVDDDDD